RASSLAHLSERAFVGCRLGDADIERTFSSQAFHQSHLPEIADMAANRALGDSNDAESFRARERRQHAALGDAEHRPIRSFAANMQTGIAVAGDDEGCRAV